jgi:hypothetical protein
MPHAWEALDGGRKRGWKRARVKAPEIPKARLREMAIAAVAEYARRKGGPLTVVCVCGHSSALEAPPPVGARLRCSQCGERIAL